MANAVMDAMDALQGSMAECFITISNRRYNFMQLYKMEVKMNITTKELPILGKPGKGNRSTGWKGTFSGTAHYNQSVLRQVLLTYKNTGDLATFDMQIANDDPASAAGRQTCIFYGCKLSGDQILSKFDASEDTLEEDIAGTFEDFDIPELFTPLPGMA
jgi:hypothetical protein